MGKACDLFDTRSIAFHVGESAADFEETVAVCFDHLSNFYICIIGGTRPREAPMFRCGLFREPLRLANDQSPKRNRFVDVKKVFKFFGRRAFVTARATTHN